METVTTIVVDPEIAWRYRPDDQVAHAFGAGRGWLRAKCRRIPLTIALVDAPASFPRCADCIAAATPAESDR